MGSPQSRMRVFAVVVVALALMAPSAVASAGDEARAFDYTTVQGLSEPTYAAGDIGRTVVKLKAFDGIDLYIEVIKPKAEGRYPVILEASPYHGTLADRDGTRILPEPRGTDGKSIGLTGFFAPRGYAVVMMDLRGTGRSQGCLDHLGPNDARDVKQVVEWAASQSWSNGRVGMTGHSYVGSTPMVAAAQNPKGLVTIVPSAGLASMYDHQFQAGVPYLLQWAGPQWAYELLAIDRHLPAVGNNPASGGATGDNFGNDMQYVGCGAQSSAFTAGEGQVTGLYQSWHRARDSSKLATAWTGTVFLIHGINDDAARIPAANWFMERGGRAGDKAWIGQWDHGSGCCPNRRGLQWPYALLGWFDKQLKGRDVDTGPAAEVFMNDAPTKSLAVANFGSRETLQASGYPAASSTLSLFPVAADSSLAATPAAAAGSKSFAGDPRGTALTSSTGTTGAVTFTTTVFNDDVVLAGMPQLDLMASVTVPQVHLIGTVYDMHPSGSRRRITTFAINPLLRNSIDTYAPVIPGQAMTLRPSGFVMGHHVLPGHRLALEITASDEDHVPYSGIDPNITVYTGPGGTALRLPVVDSPVVVEDTVRR